MSRTGSHAASTPSLSHAVRRGGSGRGAVAVILLSASAFRVPFRSDGADGQDPAGATCMDARRFSTRQGCRVEKSRRRSGPGVPQARRARRQGRAFFGPRFFARAKKGGSLLRSRGESSAFKLLLSFFAFMPRLLLGPSPFSVCRKSLSNGRGRIKGFRSPSGRELLLFARAKRSNQEKARPCLRARRAARAGSTPPPGFFDETSLSRRKTACIHARRPSGFSRRLRRCGRGPENQKQAATAKSQATATATATAKDLVLSRSSAGIASGMRATA